MAVQTLTAIAAIIEIMGMLAGLSSTMIGLSQKVGTFIFNLFLGAIDENEMAQIVSTVKNMKVVSPTFLYPEKLEKQVNKVNAKLIEAKQKYNEFLDLKYRCEQCIRLCAYTCNLMREKLRESYETYEDFWKSLSGLHGIVSNEISGLAKTLQDVHYYNCSGLVNGCGYEFVKIYYGINGSIPEYPLQEFFDATNCILDKDINVRIFGYRLMMKSLDNASRLFYVCENALKELEDEVKNLEKQGKTLWEDVEDLRKKLEKEDAGYCDGRVIGFIEKLNDSLSIAKSLGWKPLCEKQRLYYLYIQKLEDAKALGESILEDLGKKEWELEQAFYERRFSSDSYLVKKVEELTSGRSICEKIRFYERVLAILSDDYPYTQRIAYAQKLINFLKAHDYDTTYYERLLKDYERTLDKEGINNLILELEEIAKYYEHKLVEKMKALEHSGVIDENEASYLLTDPLGFVGEIEKLYDDAEEFLQPTFECKKKIIYSGCNEDSTISYVCQIYNPSEKKQIVTIEENSFVIEPFSWENVSFNITIHNTCSLEERIQKVIGQLAYHYVEGNVKGFVKMCFNGNVISCSGVRKGSCCFFDKSVEVIYVAASPIEITLNKEKNVWHVTLKNREPFPIDDADIWVLSNKEPLNFEYENGIIHIYDTFMPFEEKRYDIVFEDENVSITIPPQPNISIENSNISYFYDPMPVSTSLKEMEFSGGEDSINKKSTKDKKHEKEKGKKRREERDSGFHFDYKLAWVGLAAVTLCVFFLKKEDLVKL